MSTTQERTRPKLKTPYIKIKNTRRQLEKLKNEMYKEILQLKHYIKENIETYKRLNKKYKYISMLIREKNYKTT